MTEMLENDKPAICSNIKCAKEIPEGDGYEIGTPSGYADDYTFCKNCWKAAKKHFDIAGWHDGGMVMAPSCEGRDADPKTLHTCKFSEKERKEAMLAFRDYR